MEGTHENHKIDDLPAGLAAQCQEMAESISQQSRTVRDTKILAARMRLSSGYYDSHHVMRVIASRLLREAHL